MEKEILTIPKEIKVGFIKNFPKPNDKTGVITYVGRNGKIVKEKVWNNSRNTYMESETFENIPTEGFYVESLITGYSCRSSYTYTNPDLVILRDPRGFFVKITSVNFMNILNHCDCVEKKLYGSFVYSWDNSESLILIPTSSEIYKISSKSLKNKLEKNYSPGDLIPGTRYMFKPGSNYFSHKLTIDKDNNYITGIFIGYVKLSKDFSKKYKHECLFYCKETIYGNIGRDYVYIVNPKDIDYELTKDYLSKSEVADILRRFNNTVFSWEFWNGPGKVDMFELINPDAPGKFVKFTDLGDRLTKKIALEGYCPNNEFYYIKSFSEIDMKYNTERYFYKSSEFTISNNKIIKKDIYNLGKIITECRYNDYRRGISAIKKYPEANSGDISSIKHNPITNEVVNNTCKMVLYKTVDGEYSDSLQIALSLTSKTTIEDWISCENYYVASKMYLPIKI